MTSSQSSKKAVYAPDGKTVSETYTYVSGKLASFTMANLFALDQETITFNPDGSVREIACS